jgi:hypothetical protein
MVLNLVVVEDVAVVALLDAGLRTLPSPHLAVLQC